MRGFENKWTQIVEIKEPKILWNEIRKSNRNSIKKAISSNLNFEKVTKPDNLKEFHQMELMSRKRFGKSTPSLDFFKLSWNTFQKKGYMEVFITKYKKNPIASSIIYIFNKNVILAHLNSNNKYLKLRPNNFQLWKIIEWCYKKGYKFLNLGATEIKNEGLFFFKSSFNTINIPFVHYYYPTDSILLDNTAIGKIGESCLKKTPLFISRTIGPLLIKKFG
jgi:lipid II:glycine glycyltransferase (peptidoglycan interpeptide bridge formation enzyme)